MSATSGSDVVDESDEPQQRYQRPCDQVAWAIRSKHGMLTDGSLATLSKLLMEHDAFLNIPILSTFLLPRALKDKKSILKWHDWTKVFAAKTVLLPVFFAAHWTLAAIFPTARVIVMFDSLWDKLQTPQLARRVRDLLWIVDPRPRLTDPKEDWRFQKTPVQTTAARQAGGVECGIFVVARMLEIAIGCGHSFKQENVRALREALYQSLKMKKLADSALPPYV